MFCWSKRLPAVDAEGVDPPDDPELNRLNWAVIWDQGETLLMSCKYSVLGVTQLLTRLPDCITCRL